MTDQPLNSTDLQWTKSTRLADGTELHILRLQGTAAEIIMATLWLEFRKAGLLQIVWPGQDPSLRWLLDWSTAERPDGSPLNVIFGCLLQKGEEVTVAGMGSICTLTAIATGSYKAEVGFGFLPSVHRTPYPLEFAEMMIDWGFENLNLEVMYGTTPIPNVLACRFAERLGFRIVGTLPEFGSWTQENGLVGPCDCQVAYLLKADWFAKTEAPSGRSQ